MARTALEEEAADATGAAPSKRQRVYKRKSGVVLDAAEKAFLQYGFAATSMDDIADAAGVSKRTVYSNFGSKDELFAEVIRQRCSVVVPGEEIVRKADTLELEAGLRLIATAFLRGVFARAQVELYQTVVAAARLQPDIGRIMYEGPIMSTQDMVAAHLARQKEAGRLAIADPELASAQLIALLKTNVHMKLLLNQPAKLSVRAIEASAAESVRLFLYGYAPR